MAITLTGTSSGNQGIFNRLGKIGAVLVANDTLKLTTWQNAIESIVQLFDGCDADVRATADGLNPAALEGWRDGLSASALATVARNILIDQVHRDNPLPEQTLDEALRELIKQMKTAGDYVAANTVGATATMTSLTGNGNVIVSAKDGGGYDMQQLLAEDLVIRVESTALAGAETLRVLGEEAVGKLDYRWPRGSGASRAYTSLAADGTGNLLSNGDFETFTVANEPDNWSIVTGGSTITEENSTYYKGTSGIKFAGDGATLTQIRQALTDLDPKVPYAFNFSCRMSSNPAAGALIVDLYDGSSVIADEAGTNNTFTIDLTTLGTSFVHKSGVFRLPDPVPATAYLRIRVSTAITNTHNLFFDEATLQAMEQPGDAGALDTPYVAFTSGSTNWSGDDGAPQGTTVFKVAATNNRDGLVQQILDRLFETSGLGLFLPTSGGGSEISEALFA